ncbi:PhnD/SsuA/transferrin family substrate-binding protein [uncultured Tateyamaria sp.]|uniref:phosphate/phosphite/phosphonate ABC transporter substrate-binding protein n=1 Tax=uncultured Tateyamaria sp. TaxID=455651 RepID=UPI00262D1C22|nr:PhnD/SsuA/transferrin family substrate-binding protein [uncultured Tateyamaria sp.]
MIASLGMYDMPHATAAHDRLWTAIRAELGYGPHALDRTTEMWKGWQSPDLLISQTCGLPYRARLFGQVTLVGTPDYGLRDCPPGYYYSYIVRRRRDTRNLRELTRTGRLAYNDPLSQSGWAAPYAQISSIGQTPGNKVETGGHVASIQAVLDGAADYAGIDVVTYLMWSAAHPDAAAGLETFMRTTPTPGLPLITARKRDPKPIARAVTCAIKAMSEADRAILYLKGLVDINEATYRAQPIPPMP